MPGKKRDSAVSSAASPEKQARKKKRKKNKSKFKLNDFYGKSEQQYAELRQNLRKHHADISTDRDKLINGRSELQRFEDEGKTMLMEHVDRLDKSFGQVDRAREAVLDARNASLLNNTLRLKVNKISGNFTQLSATDMITGLREHFREGGSQTSKVPDLDWKLIGECAGVLFHAPQTSCFLKGSIMNQPKARRQFQRARVRQPTTRTSTQKRQEAGDEDELDPTLELVKAVHTAVAQHQQRTGKPVMLFDLIIHPTRFSCSVELNFATAICVKNGWLSIRVEPHDGLPYAFDTRGGNVGSGPMQFQTQPEEQSSLPNHCIVSLEKESWRALRDVIGRTEPFVQAPDIPIFKHFFEEQQQQGSTS